MEFHVFAHVAQKLHGFHTEIPWNPIKSPWKMSCVFPMGTPILLDRHIF